MTTRAQQLRARHRKIMGWSLGLAVAAHAAVLLLAPDFRVEPMTGTSADLEAHDVVIEDPVFVELTFGPPTITRPDGTLWTEPDDHRLETGRVVELSAECADLVRDDRTPLSGRVRLTVDASGNATVHSITGSTGDPCGDDLMVRMAGALRYHWLPDARFPAPVDLVQPVTIEEAM